MKPLRSLKVLDLTDGNPYIGSMFADYGAEVLKIEKPGMGDSVRRRGSADGKEEGIYQAYYHRGKRSMTLNLRDPPGTGDLKETAAGIRHACSQSVGGGYAQDRSFL